MIHWKALGLQLGTTGAVFYGTQKLFKEIEDKLHPDTKLAISVWLLDAEDAVNSNADWPATCYSMFLQIFGKRHLAWRCFYRSAIVSSIAFWAVFLLCIIQQLPIRDSLFWFVPINFPFALIPDYCSLWVTRMMLRIATKAARSTALLFALLVSDLYLSAALVTAAYTVAIVFVIASSGPPNSNPAINFARSIPSFLDRKMVVMLFKAFYPGEIRDLLTPKTWLITGPYVASAFCTSAWLWAYVGAGLLLRAARRASFGLRWANKILDIDSKPLQAIGLLVGVVVSSCWVIAVLLFAVL